MSRRKKFVVDFGIAQEVARGRNLRDAASRYWASYVRRYPDQNLEEDLDTAKIVDERGQWFRLKDVLLSTEPLHPVSYTERVVYLPTPHPEDESLESVRVEYPIQPPSGN